ncbi:IS66 family insertion sequence element accessory protein TnpB [Endozoicomonas sp. OPT23]|uniref:IS66 family insertion sequence element accessory protein TnpB n=1 Tax=Endozoicomonas sp. OPT23 TaxID=2072845 RepID=UPI00351BB8CA
MYWERIGFVHWYKRLEKFRFKWPDDDAPETIGGALLNQLLNGYEIRHTEITEKVAQFLE